LAEAEKQVVWMIQEETTEVVVDMARRNLRPIDGTMYYRC
jgi:hypothetical protein